MKLTIIKFDYQKVCRLAFQIILIFVLLGGRAASAQSCVVDGPRYNLIGDAVDWSLRIAGRDRSCVLGVRFNNVEIKGVRLISSPRSGSIALQGPGFTYTANVNFDGTDSFTLEVVGAINKKSGSSTIHVSVSVDSVAHELGAPGPVGRSPAPTAIPQVPRQSAFDNDVPLPVGTALPPCPTWDWSKGSPPPMRPPFDRTKLYCPPSPFKPPNPPVGCICPE